MVRSTHRPATRVGASTPQTFPAKDTRAGAIKDRTRGVPAPPPQHCEWAACKRKATHHLDGWWHCPPHARLHFLEHNDLPSLAEARARRRQEAEHDRRVSFEHARELLTHGHMGFTREQLVSPVRTRRLVQARQDLMLIIWLQTDASTVQLGRLFHRDHTTVIHGLRRARERRRVAS